VLLRKGSLVGYSRNPNVIGLVLEVMHHMSYSEYLVHWNIIDNFIGERVCWCSPKILYVLG